MARLKDFNKIEKVGQGSFGFAELHERRADGKYVVLKVLPNIPRDQRSRVLNEITILKSLKHVNITAFYEAWREGQTIYISMEWADGGDLKQAIEEKRKRQRHFDERTIRSWMGQLASALCYLHSIHILHRDLKSANVFLAEHKTVIKLGDFGISKQLHSSRDLARTTLGTPYYLSPEIAQGAPYNAKSDVWAAAVLLHELMTLSYPYKAHNAHELFQVIKRGDRSRHPSLALYSEALRDLLQKMLVRDCRYRYSSSRMLTHYALLLPERTPVGRSATEHTKPRGAGPAHKSSSVPAVRGVSPPVRGTSPAEGARVMPRLLVPVAATRQGSKSPKVLPSPHVSPQSVPSATKPHKNMYSALHRPTMFLSRDVHKVVLVPREAKFACTVRAAVAAGVLAMVYAAGTLRRRRGHMPMLAWAPPPDTAYTPRLPTLPQARGREKKREEIEPGPLLREAEEEFKRTLECMSVVGDEAHDSDFEDGLDFTVNALLELEAEIKATVLEQHLDGISSRDSLHTQCEALCQLLETAVGEGHLHKCLSYLDNCECASGGFNTQNHIEVGRHLKQRNKIYLPLVIQLARYKVMMNTGHVSLGRKM